MQAQNTVQFISVRFIALAFTLLAALLLAGAAGYVIRGDMPSTIAVQLPVPHEQAPDAVTRNQDLQQAPVPHEQAPDAVTRNQDLQQANAPSNASNSCAIVDSYQAC